MIVYGGAGSDLLLGLLLNFLRFGLLWVREGVLWDHGSLRLCFRLVWVGEWVFWDHFL